MSAENTRQSPRFAVEVAVALRGEIRASGSTSNVSSGGLCAIVDRPLPRGATIEVEIALVFQDSVSEPLVLPARVVWVTQLGPDRHQVGVAFLALARPQRTYLDMFLRYLQQGPAPEGGEDDPFA